MSRYLEYFPRIFYDIDKAPSSRYQLVTNILFRMGMTRESLLNASGYFEYTIREGDSPEILADKVYGDPEAHWIILYANDIKDPQYDWPLDNKSFVRHIKDKYGTVEAAKTGVHHYEKVIERFNSTTNTTTTKRIWISENSYYVLTLESANGNVSVGNVITGEANAIGYIVYDAGSNTFTVTANTSESFVVGEEVFITPANVTASLTFVADTSLNTGAEDYYYNTLPVTQSVNTYEVAGDTITETIYRQAVSYYDYEDELNESKRNIKIIKKEYYTQIIEEFRNLTNYNREYLRTLT